MGGELFSTLLLIAGGAFGMEMWARWAHKELWHENEAGWLYHKSHHEPRTGPFEANDVFAIVNAVPAIALTSFGFFADGQVGACCFGLGLGITLFGWAYMFVHDGLATSASRWGPSRRCRTSSGSPWRTPSTTRRSSKGCRGASSSGRRSWRSWRAGGSTSTTWWRCAN